MRTPYAIYYALCFVCWILLGITGVSTRSHSLVKRYGGLYTGPYVDTHNLTNVTVQLGSHAYLPCKVRQIGNKSVSWMRMRDAHILSVDRTMFIADDRFQSLFVETSNTWTLQVKYVNQRDEGKYECQISTEPKLSHVVSLVVVVPKIEILGERDRHVKIGSKVVLQCVIKRSLEVPFYIFWYHQGVRLLDQDHPGKLSIQSKLIEKTTDTVSNLTLHNVDQEDSGNYTCSPSNLDTASVQLHVLNGEHPAAIQRGISSVPGCCRFLLWFVGMMSLSPNEGERRFCALVLMSLAVALTQSYLPSTGHAWPR